MAKTQNEQEGGIHVEESFNSVEQFFEENQNIVLGILGTIIVLVAAFVIYNRFIVAPKAEEATRQVYKAQQWFEADSFRLALEGDGNYYGFLDIIDEFGGTPTGKMARYYAGISSLNTGNYDDAISYLSNFKTGDPNVQAVAYGGIGDAYAQLDDLESAVGQYEKAARTATIQDVAPVYYVRAGVAHEQLGNPEAALKMYAAVVENYPEASLYPTAQKSHARLEALSN